MGSGSEAIDRQAWTTLKQCEGFSLLKHKLTSQLFELHSNVQLSQKQTDAEVELCKAREKCGEQVVKAHFHRADSLNLCGDHKTFNVLTEHMSTRLADYKAVPFTESGFILKQALAGFKDIKEKLGKTFAVDSRMVGFTSTAQVKVWMHENMSSNYPQSPFYQGSPNSQHFMVQSIFTLFHDYTEGGFPNNFTHYLQDKLTQPFKLAQAEEIVREYDTSYIETQPKEQFWRKQSKQDQLFGSQARLQNIGQPSTGSRLSKASKPGTKREITLNLYSGPGSRM